MKKLLPLLIVLLLVGCSTTKEVVTAVETKTVLVAPPDELLLKCEVTPPPNIEEYVAADWPTKEELLTSYSTKQMKSIFKCNTNMAALQKWKKDQTDLYSKKK